MDKLEEIKKRVRAHLEEEGKIAEDMMTLLTPEERRSLVLYMAQVATKIGKKYSAYGASLIKLKMNPERISELMKTVMVEDEK